MAICYLIHVIHVTAMLINNEPAQSTFQSNDPVKWCQFQNEHVHSWMPSFTLWYCLHSWDQIMFSCPAQQIETQDWNSNFESEQQAFAVLAFAADPLDQTNEKHVYGNCKTLDKCLTLSPCHALAHLMQGCCHRLVVARASNQPMPDVCIRAVCWCRSKLCVVS